MLWAPFIAFIVTGVVAAVAQQRFYNGIAKRRGSRNPAEEFVDEVLGDPKRLIPVTARETRSRLRELITRQDDPALERARWIAVVAVATSIACFAWLAVTGPQGLP